MRIIFLLANGHKVCTACVHKPTDSPQFGLLFKVIGSKCKSPIFRQLLTNYCHRTPKTRSAWDTLRVKIARRKKWAWIAIFKPAEILSPWDACFLYHVLLKYSLYVKLDSLRWFFQPHSPTPNFWGCGPRGLWPQNSNSAEIFVQRTYPQVSSSCVYWFGSHRVDKQTNKQTPRRHWVNNEKCIKSVNPFTADPVKALHSAILV